MASAASAEICDRKPAFDIQRSTGIQLTRLFSADGQGCAGRRGHSGASPMLSRAINRKPPIRPARIRGNALPSMNRGRNSLTLKHRTRAFYIGQARRHTLQRVDIADQRPEEPPPSQATPGRGEERRALGPAGLHHDLRVENCADRRARHHLHPLRRYSCIRTVTKAWPQTGAPIRHPSHSQTAGTQRLKRAFDHVQIACVT